MDGMRLIGVDAVGVGDKELRFGLAFLRAQVKRTGLTLLSANLIDKTTRKPALTPHLIRKVGTVRVGLFGLISDKQSYGPSADSILVEEPAVAARRTVAELRRRGATVVVLLSQLGKIESEDLATTVPGIDAVIVGHNVPLLMQGRMIKNTVACYGGEQGQYIGRTILTLDRDRRVTTGENEMFMLGPEVGEREEIARLVKQFEDGYNEKMRRAEKERTARAAELEASADRYMGADLCMRCHPAEAEQWKTTSHSVAWQTLVDARKDATPECITCHVVGYGRPGGFQTGADAPRLANVQCENCHGMGTQHEAFSTAPRRVTEGVCVTCHQGENDPEWNWATKLPKILHDNLSGETIKAKLGGKSPMMGKAGQGSH